MKPEWDALADSTRSREPLVRPAATDPAEPDDTEHARREAAILRDEATSRARDLRIAPEVAFGLLREGIDLAPSAVDKVTDGAIGEALQRAIENGRFVPGDPGMLDRARDRLADLREGRASIWKWLGVEGSRQASKVRAALAERKIETFDQLRSADGRRAIEEAGRQFGPQVERELGGHVALSAIETDPARRQQLINADFATLDDIAERPLQEFVQAVAPDTGWVQAVQWHAKAQAAKKYVRKRTLDERVIATLRDRRDVATASSALEGVVSGDAASCGCRDCEAATSPAAYLADLLKYCDDNLIRTGGKIDYAYLASTVHQPFGDLPTRCDAVSDPIRQVRIAVEVLRANLRKVTGNRRAGAPAERAYFRQVYETLLTRLGTSSIDLRLATAADAASQRQFADRLGIDNAQITQGGVTTTRLQRMRIDTDTVPLDDIEARLEAVYGFSSTIVDPVARLAQAVTKPQFVAWREQYLRQQWFAQDWPDDTPGAGAPIIDPDVIGPDDFRTPLVSNPAFAIWQRRRTWVEAQLSQLAGIAPAAGQSRLEAWFTAMSATAAPVTYTPAAGTPPDTPTWVDAAALTPVPTAVLLALRAELESNDAARVTAARGVLTSRFGLTPRSYARLLELHTRERAALADARNQRLSPEELSEAVSILTQARKQKIAALWRQEETAAEQQTAAGSRLEFGPSQFWTSLTEPAEGDSPPFDDGRTPWIDPEVVATNDLPDGEVGTRARTTHGQRTTEFATARAALATAVAGAAAEGRIDAAIAVAYATPAIATGGATVAAYVDATAVMLNSSLAPQVVLGEQRLRDVLFLDVDSFRRLMTLVTRDRQTDPALKPTAAEISEAIAILLVSRKARVFYPRWRSEERAAAPAGLAHWEALKITLPMWRGSADSRAQWRLALSVRRTTPIIDPDLIDEACLVQSPLLVTAPLPATASMADKVALRWKLRRAEITNALATLRTAREAQAAAADSGLGALLAAVGSTVAHITDLATAAASGRAIGKRLAQLDLDTEAFDALRRIAALITAGQTVDVAEWDTAYSIVTEIWKRRQSQRWRSEERTAGIALDPAAFKVPTVTVGSAGVTAPWDQLPAWRAHLQDRLEWESRLQGRIDQLATVATAHGAVLSAAEQAGLPPLRDSLVLATSTPLPTTASLGERATYLGGRLLIDLQNSGCASTTRVAQAIETIQNLLFSLRTGQLRDVYPDWAIRADALLEFDAVWNWLGSYGNWRAAMFVLIYPENLAVPTLRRTGSPAFWEMTRELRNQGTVDPRQAIVAHETFRRYFLDLSELEQTTLRVSATDSSFFDERMLYAHGGVGRTSFLFALTPLARGRRLYWSTRYNDASGRAQQSYWRQLTQFSESIEEVLGASAYVTPSGRPYLYLVVKTAKDQVNHLWFLRFDLQEEGTWDAEPTQLTLSGDVALLERFKATLLQTSRTETPRIRVEDPSNTANIFVLYLDRLGESGDSAIQTLGQPSGWSPTTSLPNLANSQYSLPSGETLIVNGRAAGADVTVGGMVAVSLRDPAQTDLIIGHSVLWVQRPSDVHLPEVHGILGLYQVLWNVNAQGVPCQGEIEMSPFFAK